MVEPRLQVSGGWMTTQDLRDLVGWAGSAGSAYLRTGDSQDWVLESPTNAPGPPPPRFALRDKGSLQSSAYHAGSPPWLTTGVWMDLLSLVPDPGDLDVQLVHDSARHPFWRWGHLRLTALRASHQWEVKLRRPGTTGVASLDPAIDTGGIPDLIHRLRQAWEDGTESAWEGAPAGFRHSEALERGEGDREGFHDETPGAFSFGFWSPEGRFSVDRLRDLAWLAWESGAPRIWLTPGRLLLFPGLPASHRADWERWLVKNRLPSRHGDLDHGVRASGTSQQTADARAEVVNHLRATGLMPPSRTLLVASEPLNRGDGVGAVPHPVLIHTSSTWLFRSGDGNRSGEGTLKEVLAELESPPSSSPGPQTMLLPIGDVHRCVSCLTVYDPRWGDPRGGMEPGTAFSARPDDWTCPVCGGPAAGFTPWNPAENSPLLTSSLDF